MKTCRKKLHQYSINKKTCPKCEKLNKALYFSKNKEKILEKNRNYYSNNSATILLQKQEYLEVNRDAKLSYEKEYYSINKIAKNDYDRKYYQLNKEEIIQKNTTYHRERLKTDINYKLGCNLRSRLGMAIRGDYKSGSAVKDLGCTIEEFKFHLESSFYPNSLTGEVMSWDNRGLHGWHIDHIRPLVSFDLSNIDQLKEACCYVNLQPLWAKDNLSKGDRYSGSY